MTFSGRLLLLRHGETEWARNGKHTGRTNIGLTAKGEDEARAAKETLVGWEFERVYSSPLQRARHTAELVALPNEIELDDRLLEWDYGASEGMTTEAMRENIPGWSVWTHPATTAESADDVGARVDDFVAELPSTARDIAVFAHGHLLAVFIARWLDLAAVEGRRFKLETATVTMLDIHREDRVIRALNHRCGDAL